MKIAVGNDIVENSRIRKIYEEYGHKFLTRIFTEEEIQYCLDKKDPIPHLAARFACKEAFIKACDIPGYLKVDLREISLTGQEFGKKKLFLSGKSRELFESKGYDSLDASISHSDSYSFAVVLLYSTGEK